jgi:hypothetical protein
MWLILVVFECFLLKIVEFHSFLEGFGVWYGGWDEMVSNIEYIEYFVRFTLNVVFIFLWVWKFADIGLVITVPVGRDQPYTNQNFFRGSLNYARDERRVSRSKRRRMLVINCQEKP